jgi:cyclopropane fatty-acyl-phospholipid synthase-like methyltransferase
MMQILEPFDFSVLDVENLRLHYAKTLEHWLQRYENNIGRVKKMFDAEFARTWRLYLAEILLDNKRFTRHVLLDRWFLHIHQESLYAAGD